MTDEYQGKTRPASRAILASNVALVAAAVAAILWPLTGHRGLGVVALGLALLAVSFAGLNVTQRGRRSKVRLVRPAEACGGSCAACTLSCDTGKAS
jgi:hypothetical protein